MSPPNDITATQSSTVRVTVDHASRRDAAEPIGRSFADLLDEVRPKDATTQPKSPATNNRPQSEFSSGEYLVVNASLSEPTSQTAGLLQHEANSGVPVLVEGALEGVALKSLDLDSSDPDLGAGNEVTVDTSGLFLPPNPNQPVQVNAAVVSAGFGLSSWPPPDTPTAIASLLATGKAGQLTAQPTAGAGLDLAATVAAAPADDASALLAAGPGANRSASRFPGAEQTQSQAPSTAAATANTAANASSAASPPSGAPAQPSAQPAGPVIDFATIQQGASFFSDSTTIQPLTASQPGATTANQSPTAATHSAPQTLASAPAATVQIYARFIERFDGRSQQYQVRLDPPELGRVNVRIEINSDNRVHAVLATHDSAALSDLVRGQRALEQALADAGIDLAEGGLQFELTDRDGGDFASANDPNNSFQRSGARASGNITEGETGEISPLSQHAWSRGRVNIVA